MEISCSSTSVMASWLPTKPSSSPYYASLASGNSAFFSDVGDRLSKRRLGLVSAQKRRAEAVPASRGALGCRCLFGFGVPELAVIAGVAALVFGPKQLPEIGRSIGKTVKSFQQAAKEFETELKKEPEEVSNPPPAESPNVISTEGDKKELEASGSKEST